MSSEWPLYFTHRESIEGKGYLAQVNMQGRVLVAREKRSDSDLPAWVFYGVQPSSLSAEAESVPSAFALFRERLKDILFSIADDARDFDEFHAAVSAFFSETDSDADVWVRRAAEVRAGQTVQEMAVSRLPRRVAHEVEPTCSVVNVSAESYRPSPENNVASQIFQTTAA